jgi:hypothetical protein
MQHKPTAACDSSQPLNRPHIHSCNDVVHGQIQTARIEGTPHKKGRKGEEKEGKMSTDRPHSFNKICFQLAYGALKIDVKEPCRSLPFNANIVKVWTWGSMVVL